MKKRDINVELIRIIACLIIVGVHTCLYQIVDDRADLGRTFISCLLADGVAVFWMITGFFLFRNHSYSKPIKHALKNIGLPMLTISVVIFYLGEWLMQGTTLSESLNHPISDYKKVINSVLCWTNSVEGLGHLWYLYVYLMVMATFPVLKTFVDYLDQESKRTIIFLIFTLGFFMVNDITGNSLAEFSHHSINGAIPAATEMIWGHIVYKHKDIFKKKKYIWGSVLVFLGLNLLRTGIQMKNFSADLSDKNILYWYTSLGLLCALCVIIFGLSLNINSERISNGIIKLSSYTFLIYLLHPLVKNVLIRFDVQNKVTNAIVSGNIFSECLYTGIMIVVLSVISFIIAVILKFIKNIGTRVILTNK